MLCRCDAGADRRGGHRPAPGNPMIVAPHGERDRRALEDLVEFGALAEDLVARGKAAYDSDVQLQLAGEAIQHRVGEAVSRLSVELVSDNPQIRFRAMRKARNKVAHNYQVVDPELVWNTLALALSEDIAKVRDLLAC